ncbi:long-chain-fatty-acid--CoA ligase [Cumulibacter soli]|uniref:long-chain-fatty-acid--CoA ligase n=1 Tax=Cumulibacter soli TaxID=2546344 RepID=UPI001ABAEDDE|nr:long-chain-fatty-acid--CoA ligase [Cumulibacter soli]
MSDIEAIAGSRRMSLGEQLARWARKAPERPALTYQDSDLTYGELDARVSRLARGLRDLGVQPGDRVAVFMQNRAEVIESYFAVVRLGAIAVPVNFRLAAPEAQYVVENSGSSVLLADDPLVEDAAKVRASLESNVTFVVCGGRHAEFDALAYEDILSDDGSDLGVDVNEHEPAFLMYTSGTTGRPKGAVITHFNLMMNSMNSMVGQRIEPEGEVWLSGLPLFHIGGLNGILNYVMAGGHTILMASGNFSAEDVVQHFEKDHVTSCYFVPTQWKEICEVPNVTERSKSLRRISWGASIAPPSVLQAMADAFPGVPNFNMFGQTEMSSVTCVLRGEDAVRKMGTVGQPVPMVEARLVDEQMNDVPQGEVGEIVYRGPTVMREYWRNPEATAEAFRGGWFHSGDLCVMDEDGFIKVVDRAKDMIISGGENIYCAEVEAAIDAHPKVSEVTVVARPHPKWVETPVAYIVPVDQDDAPSEDEIIDWCRQRIASYKKPSAVVITDGFPRNASGKVQKFILREEQRKAFG